MNDIKVKVIGAGLAGCEAAWQAAKLGVRVELFEMKPHELLSLVGKKRGFLVSGGEIDTERAANMLLDEFRSGKIGKITLERPFLEGGGTNA